MRGQKRDMSRTIGMRVDSSEHGEISGFHRPAQGIPAVPEDDDFEQHFFTIARYGRSSGC